LDKNSKIYSSGNNEYDLMIIKINEKEANDYLELDQNRVLYREFRTIIWSSFDLFITLCKW